MAPVTASLGLGLAAVMAPTLTNHAPAYLCFHFIFAYGVLSSRTLKQFWGLDHNASPRYDLAKYGESAVTSGRIQRWQLEMLQRNESAHANAVENFTFFATAIGFATFSGVNRDVVNRAGLVYSAARVAYGLVYILIDHPLWSQIRGITWWIGNGTCLYLLYKASEKLND
ncbi:hypothetical protein CMQ_6694 [Grosmannia clavigera kw1407]|uniref:Uncharacterized protein n=1 Tax=Grosmannia clavigera (strain kw1407 / UAMH 11150) TaxID=655863 RepID=F0X7A4_GROCL|nr:uncharacterized protein CMQ_6694 [Grosmannia clavigera kw1407]EFX06373.1 hypothetical protein CMQ_6694 [Grosmannia clavigera kw1407]